MHMTVLNITVTVNGVSNVEALPVLSYTTCWQKQLHVLVLIRWIFNPATVQA